VSIALDDNSVCPNQTIHFTSTVTGGTNLTYQWLDGTGNALGNGATLDFVPQQPGYGTVSLRVADANGCAVTSPPITYYRYDTPKPAITPLGPTTFCDSGNVTLEAPPASSYLWSTGATTRSITAWASGTFRVTITDGSGCTLTSDPLSVTALPRPPQPTITASGPLTFCEGGSVTLTAPDGYPSYHWSTGETTKTITVSTTRNVALTVINAAGCDNTSDVQVTVNPLPAATITASGPTTFCEGGSVTLTAPAGFAFAWSNGATARSITVAASGTYAVTVTNANGCSASASTSVTVNPLPSTPTITASGPLTFCEGGSVTLTAPAGYAYAWSNGATARSITVAASGTYTVTVTNANGCSASASTSVTVNPLPSTPTITASGQLTFCEGGSVTLTAPAGYAYAWSNGATTRSITAAATGAYRVTVTNASGCSATSAATNVTVNPKPATPTITASGPTALCPGASVTLAAPAGYTYAWSNGATAQSITVSTAGPYSVTVTNASGCSTASAPVVVTNNAPTVITTQPQSKTIARNVSTTLSVAAGGTEPLQYQWYAGTSGDTTQALAGQTSATVSVGPFSKKSTNRYWVRVWSSTCSSSAVNSTTAVVTVN
jgi:D-lyxose ketol-isomerase